mmetsp:Transcript_35454/g.83434  ORF Transcript_35454/g.83434 Transcript_35454/m.83434 type:complete len:175 (+) Transcript_35454:47-571(+)|eukprot:CAMPEP_0177697850 /NCGR_PEP_ID=MMETSP0484_2-20121128/4733_1 /TAXON_ID=354590 /ORGANISM="Rhodomonas lens, Strain RHODO" /LENGTH=174 /DNA_ID=CAMNT_0019208915 /DNA_START=39 /DNA_END=563 /DNA_ORIENTATION=+
MDGGKSKKKQVQGLSEEQLQWIREVFEYFDRDGNGGIDSEELMATMRALGQPTSNAEADALIATLDTSGDGSVSFQEFVEFIKPRILSKDMEKEVREQFEEFASQGVNHEGGDEDDRQKGAITKEGLARIAKEIDEVVPEEELDEIIRWVNGDENSQAIELNKFLEVCKEMRLF